MILRNSPSEEEGTLKPTTNPIIRFPMDKRLPHSGREALSDLEVALEDLHDRKHIAEYIHEVSSTILEVVDDMTYDEVLAHAMQDLRRKIASQFPTIVKRNGVLQTNDTRIDQLMMAHDRIRRLQA